MDYAQVKRIPRLILSLSIIMLLIGCGGGGGGSSPVPEDVTFKLLPNNYFEQGYQESYLLSGTDTNGNTYEGSYSMQPDSITMFNGEQAISYETFFTITNKQTKKSFSDSATEYYSTNPSDRRWLGQISLTNNFTMLPISMNAFPETAQVGDAGTIGSYVDSDGETETMTWQLKTATNGLADLVMICTYQSTGTEEHTFTIDQNGNRKSFFIKMYCADCGVTITLSGNRT